MELKPTKGLKVVVRADREAIFGDESVSMQKVSVGENNKGVMTGLVLAGFCEVDMQKLDGRKHWYPIESLLGEKGEKIVEEEIVTDSDLEAEGGEEAAE